MSPSSTTGFDVGKTIPLVPVFHESEVETYFSAFEQNWAVLSWLQDVWALLLQCKLCDKAQETLASLSAAPKGAVLLAYELVPRAYQQHFRGPRKSQSQPLTLT